MPRRRVDETPGASAGEQEPDPWGLGTDPKYTAPAAPKAPPPFERPPPRGSGSGRRGDRELAAQGVLASASQARGEKPAYDLPAAGPGYDRIVERVFNLPDPEAEYEALEKALQLGTQAYESIAAALDGAEDHARRAHRLYVCARADSERFNLDAEVIEAAMRSEAVGELQREKDAGVRTKTITEADTAGKVAALFPDEHRDLSERRLKVRKTVEHLESFAGLWRSRCFSLAKMLESKR